MLTSIISTTWPSCPGCADKAMLQTVMEQLLAIANHYPTTCLVSVDGTALVLGPLWVCARAR